MINHTDIPSNFSFTLPSGTEDSTKHIYEPFGKFTITTGTGTKPFPYPFSIDTNYVETGPDAGYYVTIH
jgi:hypothetical protein